MSQTWYNRIGSSISSERKYALAKFYRLSSPVGHIMSLEQPLTLCQMTTRKHFQLVNTLPLLQKKKLILVPRRISRGGRGEPLIIFLKDGLDKLKRGGRRCLDRIVLV